MAVTTIDSDERPPLREDLILLAGPLSPGGCPTWTLHDPVRNAFFRIGRREFEILNLWDCPDRVILKSLDRTTTLRAGQADIHRLHVFLAANNLLDPSAPAVAERLRHRAAAGSGNGPIRFLSRAFFFRIPMIRPDRFLSRTIGIVRAALPVLRFIFPPALLFSLFILLRQWPAFMHTFAYFFTVKGIVLYGIAILAAKLAHELGHAYAAKYFGLHVPTMGVAFMVMWPILYTDTTQAWRIRERGPRMIMAAAGILVELFIAVLSTLGWALMPEGPARSTCFVLASTTWVKSLIFNAMPFLRYDGYYFLSDFLNIPNLHARASAFGRWYLRKGLLGTRHQPPETVSPARHAFLILFAYGTWAYRFLIFSGIAFMVYHLLFKALGLVLFAVGIFWFLGRPVGRELSAWPPLINQAGFTRQNLLFLTVLVLMGVGAVLPLGRFARVPALVRPGTGSWIYPPDNARIETVHVGSGQRVRAGELLFQLSSPELDQKIRLARTELAMVQAQVRRQMTRLWLRDRGRIYIQQLASARTALAGYEHRKDQLTIRAGTDGILVDLSDGIRPGRWVNATQRLALLVDDRHGRIEALVPEADLGRILPQSPCRFYPDIPEAPVPETGRLTIARTGCRILSTQYLASVYGGPVPVIPENNTLMMHQSLYRVISPPLAELPFQIMPGRLCIRVKPESLLARFRRYISAAGIRESGF